jgi:uncharacterized protein
MNEADAFAELLGKGPKTVGVPTEVPPAAAQKPLTPPTSTFDYAVLGGSLIAICGWIIAAEAILDALYGGGFLSSIIIVDIVANLLIFGGIIGTALLCSRLVKVAPAVKASAIPLALTIGFAMGLGGLLFSFGEAWIGGHVVDPVNPTSGNVMTLMLGTMLVLFQTASEEIFFRGWFQRVLCERKGLMIGVIGSSLAFAAPHIIGGARDTLSLLNLFLAGLFFGLLAIRTGGLAAPIAAHFGWNWGEQILLGFDPNPGIGSFGAIIDRDLAGSALWGGSTEGLNASVAITFVLLALILPLAAWKRQPT